MTIPKTQSSHLVVLGIASDDKPHAARFNATDHALVCKVAESMQLRVARPDDDAAVKLVRKLPTGRIFSSGKGLVPLVKPALYDELLKALRFDVSAPAVVPPSEAPATKSSVQPQPPAAGDAWDAIVVGTVVLAFEEDEEGTGWWEAVVIAVSKDKKNLSLRWREWPQRQKVSRLRREVGLLAPKQ